MLYTHSKAYVCHYGQNNLAYKALFDITRLDNTRLVITRFNASLRNLYAILMQSCLNAISLQSLYNLVSMQSRLNAISFLMQSLYNLYAISVQSLCNLYAISADFCRFLRMRF